MIETRYWRVPALELRGADGALPTIAGYAAVYNRLSQNLGGFVEQVDPSAFSGNFAREADFKSCWNHNGSQILGRSSAGNLTVESDVTGLAYAVTPPSLSYGRDLAELVASGIVKGSSFTFRTLPGGDRWSLTEQGFPLRTLTAVELFELGPVTDPAYLDTEAEGASVALRSLAVSLNRRPEEVMEAAAANELRSIMTPLDDRDENDQAPPASRLDVQRRRLALASRSMRI